MESNKIVKVPNFDSENIKNTLNDASKKAKVVSKKLADLLTAVDTAKYVKTVFKLVNFAKTPSKLLLKSVPGLEKEERELLLTIHQIVYDKIITEEMIQQILKVLENAKGVAISMFRQLSGEINKSEKSEDFANKLVEAFSSGFDVFSKIKTISNLDKKTMKLQKLGGTKEEMEFDENTYKKKALKYKKKYIRLKNKLKEEGTKF